MQTDRKKIRYAHAIGHTVVCYSDDGKFIFTCGSDSDVRIWESIEDEDPTSHSVGTMALSLIFRHDKLYVGTDNNIVQVYNFPDLSIDGKPLRFSAPVTDIDISSDGNILVASSCDMDIQVAEINTKSIKKLSGHSAPVLSVTLDPKLQFVASSSCDSTVKVWDIASSQVVKNFDNVIPSNNDFFTAICLGRPAWQCQTGLYLAVVKEKKINIFSRDNWNLKCDLSYSKIQKLISTLAFSPNGHFVCAATIIGEIIIWNFNNRNVISYSEHPKKAAISRIAWHPTDYEIVYCDRLGQLGVLTVKKDEMQMYKGIEISEDLPKDKMIITKENDDEKNENEISIEKIKASSDWISLTNYKNDNESETEEMESVQSFSENRLPMGAELQPCFQPSSTPSHLQDRYMVWNSIGIVRNFNSENENSINVEFHDSMFHHTLHFSNNDRCNIACLSRKVLALASRSEDELPRYTHSAEIVELLIKNGANVNEKTNLDLLLNKIKLISYPLKAWDGMKSWSIVMPKNENIIALAASGNWICCATDLNHLRIYNYTGIQRQVLSLPGPVVCINGHEQLLFVIYHIGIGLPYCQNLGYIIIGISELSVKAIIPSQPVPLFPKSILKWVGFTDEGTPCLYDSEGIVRISSDYLNWMVVCDTRTQNKSTSDHYFIVGISEVNQKIRCILCKGSYYPTIVPRPTIIELSLKIPLCEPDSEKTILEDNFWRLIFALPILGEISHTNDEMKNELNNNEKLLKKTVIKLFANAIRANADMRAVDIAMLMSEQPLEIAVKYAAKVGKIYLTEKLNNIKPKNWNFLNQRKNNFLDFANNFTFIDDLRSDVDNEINDSGLNKFSQGDMFEDSQIIDKTAIRNFPTEKEKYSTSGTENNSCSNTFSHENSSFNPFKVNNKEERGPKGLNFFNSINLSASKPSKSEINADKISKIKQVNSGKDKIQKYQPKKQKFVEWFNNQKKNLQSKFPEMNMNDLTKAAMKIYREETSELSVNDGFSSTYSSKKIQEYFEPEPESSSAEAKKRKIEDIENDKSKASTSVSAKLNRFNFVK